MLPGLCNLWGCLKCRLTSTELHVNYNHTCQLSRFSRESPSFSSNLPAVADSREGPPGVPPLLSTSFPGFSLTHPMEPYSLTRGSSVGQVGENPGNEVALLLDQTEALRVWMTRPLPYLKVRSGSATAQSPG